MDSHKSDGSDGHVQSVLIIARGATVPRVMLHLDLCGIYETHAHDLRGTYVNVILRLC